MSKSDYSLLRTPYVVRMVPLPQAGSVCGLQGIGKLAQVVDSWPFDLLSAAT